MNENNKAVAIVGGGDQANRKEGDYYPTPKECTVALMDFLYENVDSYFNKGEVTRVWEPACGDGAISKIVEGYGNNVLSTDISTEYGEQLDFFDHNFPKDPKRGIFDAIITNPPFKHAEKFILESLKVAPVVCMLLKSQYWHAKGRLLLFHNNPPKYILPLTWRPDFLQHTRKAGEKGNPTMDVCWSVWVGLSSGSQYFPISKPTNKITLL
jgi:hypothetical protein